MLIKLIESTSNGVKARVRLLSAGMGSSGFYPAEVIERDGPTAFPAGTKLYIDHIGESEEWERNGSRSVNDLVGKTLTDAEYDPVEEALYADVLFYHGTADRIKEIFEDIDLSIEASGKRDESGEITELLVSKHNRVALVPEGGRDGKITEFLESVKDLRPNLKESGKIDSTEQKEFQEMKPEDIAAVVAALKAELEPRFSAIEESLKPVGPADDASISEVVEALIAADLPEDLRKNIYESAEPLKAIEAIASIRESLKSADKEVVGKIQEASKNATSFLSGSWGSKR